MLYSQEAREYALWAVWVACSCAALLRAIRRDAEGTGRSKLAWVAFSLATVAGLYTSFSMVAVSLAQAVFVAIRERGRPTRIVLRTAVALAGAGLAFLPWITGFLEAFDRFQATMTWSERIEIPRLQLLQELGINVARTLVDFWPDPEGLLPGAVTACAAGLILLAIRRTARVPDTGLLPALVLVVPIASLLLPDLVFGGIRSISARYLTPAWVVSVAALACLPWIGQARKWTGTLLVAALAVGIASNIAGAGRDVTWTKGISRGLPEVAERVNQAESPLVIGNEERYNPGNLLALAVLLKPDANMQLLKIAAEKDHVLPPHPGEVFLFTPTDPFRHALEVRESVGTRLVFRDLHLDLWRIERPARTTTRTTP